MTGLTAIRLLYFTVAAVFGGFFFIWREMTFRNPVVQLRVLKNGNLAGRHNSFFYYGIWFVWNHFYHSVYTQATLGWTATQAGMLMVPAALTTAFMMPFIGKICKKEYRNNTW